MCTGAATVLVDGVCEPDARAEMGPGVPFAEAREATAWRSAEVSWELGVVLGFCGATGGVAAGVALVGWRYMASMVGRREAPKGVDKKSDGRSGRIGYCQNELE